MTDNPYQSPVSKPVAVVTQDTKRIAAAQKTLIAAILFYPLAAVGQAFIGSSGTYLLLGVLIFGVVGIVRLAAAFRYGRLKIALLILSLFVPLLGLILLLRLNAKATKELQAAGYKVGLLGART